MRRFDVLVIGTGVSGQTAAADCAAAGLATAVVDRLPFGGTCAQRGCEPKKVLLGPVQAVDAVRRLAGRGPVGEVRLDWPALQAFKRTYTDPVPARTERWMAEAGITLLHGTARFLTPESQEIDGEEVAAAAVVIAAGARPAPLGIDGEELVATSERFLGLDELPARIVFLGGGYISFEFAHMAAAAGAAVTIAHRGPAPLKGFDPGLAARLVDIYRAGGIEVLLDAPVAAVRKSGGALLVEAGGRELPCDLVVHGAGRIPDLRALDLDAGGVASGPRGVEVGDDLRSTTNPRVFACGDAASRGAPLTPVGIRQGAAIARTLSGGPSPSWQDAVTPSVVFSAPPLASVGLGEEEARAAGLDIEVVEHDTTGWFTSTRLGVPSSAAKMVLERGSRRVLGAHILGDAAEEVVNVLAVAIATGATADMLKALPLAYPTSGSDLVYLF
jgi:glutathione reductase (NADPH)